MSDTHTDPVPAPPASEPPKDKRPGLFDRATMQGVVTLGLLIAVVLIGVMCYFWPPKTESLEMIRDIVKSLLTLLAMAVAYYLGQQSATK